MQKNVSLYKKKVIVFIVLFMLIFAHWNCFLFFHRFNVYMYQCNVSMYINIESIYYILAVARDFVHITFNEE